MQIETNINGDRIAYESLYRDMLSESENELYLSATKDAENAIASIEKVQAKRKVNGGEINRVLLDGDLRELKRAADRLNDAATRLLLIDRAIAQDKTYESSLEKTLKDHSRED